MTSGKMHADEVDIDAALVGQLVAAQVPQWADLPLSRVASAGTDHALYRLGDAMVVRLPRIANVTGQLEKEQRWLPYLAPNLPLKIPVPLAKGEPGFGYPFDWSVYTWLDGENATRDRLRNPAQSARDLAGFICALQQIDNSGGPSPGAHNFGRGELLANRDAGTRKNIHALRDEYDANRLTSIWEAAHNAPAHSLAPVWIHGDLQSGNLLCAGGQLHAVIDFGGLGVGDPAVDLIVAWNLFAATERSAFRKALAIDDAVWLRGRGWALTTAVTALPYYRQTNPVLAGIARHTLAQLLTDTG